MNKMLFLEFFLLIPETAITRLCASLTKKYGDKKRDLFQRLIKEGFLMRGQDKSFKTIVNRTKKVWLSFSVALAGDVTLVIPNESFLSLFTTLCSPAHTALSLTT